MYILYTDTQELDSRPVSIVYFVSRDTAGPTWINKISQAKHMNYSDAKDEQEDFQRQFPSYKFLLMSVNIMIGQNICIS